MILILIFIVACGAMPVQKSKHQLEKNIALLPNDSNLATVTGIHREEDEFRIANGSIGAVHSFLVNLGSEKKVRSKRFIARSGMCPENEVMMPRPIGCISCEQYKELTGRNC